MKFILVTIAMVSLVACSSTTKTTTTETTTPAATAATTPSTSTSSDAPTTTTTKKTTTTTSTDTSTSTDGGGFPTITGTEKSAVTCTNKADTRKISVLSTDGGCGVVYNKMGADKTVAVAKTMGYCETVSGKMKTNLEGAGFNCGGEATTSSSSDQAQ